MTVQQKVSPNPNVPDDLSLVFRDTAWDFWLASGLRLMRKRFKGKVNVEVPFREIQTSFELYREGVYAIWHKGDLFRKTPVKRFRPKILRQGSGQQIRLFSSWIRPHINDVVMGRMELFSFSAERGAYQLQLAEGSCISEIEAMLTSKLPAKTHDKDKYTLQIRESQAFYLFPLSILLGLLSIACMVLGLVMGILL